jgi:transposase
VSRKKSDPGDTLVLTNILRTDMRLHRPLPADSDQAKSARLSLTQLRSALKLSGRTRGVDAEAERLRAVFRAQYAYQPPAVEKAFGTQLRGLLVQLDAARQAGEDLAQAVEPTFRQHPDAEILLSFPGLGVQLAARILAEIGVDGKRSTDARSLKAYAGSAPITRASGKKHYVGLRFAKNNGLMPAGFLWAVSFLRALPGVNARHARPREHGDWHAGAQRNLLKRLLGQLHHCLQNRLRLDAQHAFTSPRTSSLTTAA